MLTPGSAAMLAVVLEIRSGLHAQSSTPTEDYLIAFTAEVEPTAGIKAGKPVYPKGQVKQYPALGKLSVYDGRVVVRVPLDVTAEAKPGETTIKGKLNYQICDDQTCFPPESTPFAIPVKVGGPGDEARRANAELFQGYLPAAGGGAVGKPIDPTTKSSVDAALNVAALQPGKPAKLAVVVDVAPGFHAQANPATGTNIATAVELEPTAGLTFGPPAYPPGKQEAYPDIGTLSVYGGRTIVRVPIEVKPDAPAGSDVKIAGGVTVQVCDDKGTCFRPVTLPFELTARVAAATEAVAANAPELFLAAVPPVPSTSPAAPSRPAAVRSPQAELFGLSVGVDSFFKAVGLAFCAGLIFNFMPCVLPVLPLKAVGFYEASQHNRGRTISFGLSFSLGVIAVFAVLAVLVLLSKSIFGRTFAWGQQFSYAPFVWFIAVLLGALGVGMLGAFALRLPTSVYGLNFRHDTLSGNFLWGGLTAILSTPCTAPLFPVVLAYSIGQPLVLGVSIVLMVGVGMAFPYLLLSAFPGAARRLPRTGPFSELVKQMMGFLLLASAAFFAGLQLLDDPNQWWLVFAVVCWGSLFLVVRTTQLTKGSTPLVVATAVAVALTGGMLTLTLTRLTSNAVADNTSPGGAGASGNGAVAGAGLWKPYSPEALADARKGGKIVVVKFTAKWCLNCKYIESTVYQDAAALEALRTRDAVLLKADLTDNRAAGWALLEQLTGGNGIPFTAVYAPGDQEPIGLASIYTTDRLIDALRRAGRETAVTRAP